MKIDSFISDKFRCLTGEFLGILFLELNDQQRVCSSYLQFYLFYQFFQGFINFYYIYLSPMNQVQGDQIDLLSNLSLSELLEKEELQLDAIFSIKDILSKIKKQMKMFIDYCKIKQNFTFRMIDLGFHTPVEEKSDQRLKNLVHISADIVTSDHEAIVQLLIMSAGKQYDSSDEDEIQQQIETEENTHEINENDKYKYLDRVVRYILGDKIQENCLNYIMKCLQNVASKNLNAFLTYLGQFPETLEKIIEYAHYPSVSSLIAKLVTDDDDFMQKIALQTKSQIISLLLQKIHKEISYSQTSELLQCIESILKASQYEDPQYRSTLNFLSDVIVSEEQLNFHMNMVESNLVKISGSSINIILNSVSYLSLVVARMSIDEKNEFADGKKPYRPTLKYSQKSIFPSFCRLILNLQNLQSLKSTNPNNFKLLYIRYVDFLVLMTKHSLFSYYYSLISKQTRVNSIQILISIIANRKISGILLQLISLLLQKIILSQQNISQSNPENPNKVSPSELYTLISKYYQNLHVFVKSIMIDTPKQRNKNEDGIYLRKLLIVLDNFFSNKEIQKSFPQIQTVSKLFSTFNLISCKKYAILTDIGEHPSFNKRTPQQLLFLQRNRSYLYQLSNQDIQAERVKLAKQQQEQKLKKEKDSIIKKRQQKGESTLSPNAKRQSKQIGQINVDSPNRSQVAPQPCLLFFIRHLAIY